MSARAITLNTYILVGLFFLLVVSTIRVVMDVYEKKHLIQLLADDIKLNVELSFQTETSVRYLLPDFNVPYKVKFQGKDLTIESMTSLNWTNGIMPSISAEKVKRTLEIPVFSATVFEQRSVIKIIPVSGGVRVERSG